MAALTREQFTSRRIGTTKTIDIDGVGTVRIRELSIAEVMELGTLKNKNHEAAEFVLIHGLVDDDGKPLLTPEDAATIQGMGVATTNRIVSEVMEFCGVKKAENSAPKV